MSDDLQQRKAALTAAARARVMQHLDDALAPLRVKKLEAENERLRQRLRDLGEEAPAVSDGRPDATIDE